MPTSAGYRPRRLPGWPPEPPPSRQIYVPPRREGESYWDDYTQWLIDQGLPPPEDDFSTLLGPEFDEPVPYDDWLATGTSPVDAPPPAPRRTVAAWSPPPATAKEPPKPPGPVRKKKRAKVGGKPKWMEWAELLANGINPATGQPFGFDVNRGADGRRYSFGSAELGGGWTAVTELLARGINPVTGQPFGFDVNRGADGRRYSFQNAPEKEGQGEDSGGDDEHENSSGRERAKQERGDENKTQARFDFADYPEEQGVRYDYFRAKRGVQLPDVVSTWCPPPSAAEIRSSAIVSRNARRARMTRAEFEWTKLGLNNAVDAVGNELPPLVARLRRPSETRTSLEQGMQMARTAFHEARKNMRGQDIQKTASSLDSRSGVANWVGDDEARIWAGLRRRHTTLVGSVHWAKRQLLENRVVEEQARLETLRYLVDQLTYDPTADLQELRRLFCWLWGRIKYAEHIAALVNVAEASLRVLERHRLPRRDAASVFIGSRGAQDAQDAPRRIATALTELARLGSFPVSERPIKTDDGVRKLYENLAGAEVSARRLGLDAKAIDRAVQELDAELDLIGDWLNAGLLSLGLVRAPWAGSRAVRPSVLARQRAAVGKPAPLNLKERLEVKKLLDHGVEWRELPKHVAAYRPATRTVLVDPRYAKPGRPLLEALREEFGHKRIHEWADRLGKLFPKEQVGIYSRPYVKLLRAEEELSKLNYYHEMAVKTPALGFRRAHVEALVEGYVRPEFHAGLNLRANRLIGAYESARAAAYQTEQIVRAAAVASVPEVTKMAIERRAGRGYPDLTDAMR